MDISTLSSYLAYVGLTPILAGAAGGFLRSGVGYLKARVKHGDKFEIGKFSKTVILMTFLGAVVGYFMTSPNPLFVGALALSGGVMIDALACILVGRREKPQPA